jgi:hypothetical protein
MGEDPLLAEEHEVLTDFGGVHGVVLGSGGD